MSDAAHTHRQHSSIHGNISETKWKTLGESQQAYSYKYDDLNRLLKASYIDLNNPLNNGRYNEAIKEYDRNGNILGLQRKNNVTGWMDNLTYTYAGNQLLKVEDTGTKTDGFKDGSNTGNDYAYDNNGNMSQDLNKNINAIGYNFLNLPETVTKSGSENIQYHYTATGSKVKQITTENGKTKTTDYAGPFVYENDTLQYILHEEGRITLKNNQPVYEYFLRDHLGNVRTAFTTNPETETATATLDGNAEDQQFLRVDNVRKVYSNILDKTKDATNENGYAIRLSGGPAEKIGLAKSLQVLPGDKVHMEVYAKYIDPNHQADWQSIIFQIAAAVATGGTTSTPVIDGSAYNTGSDAGGFPLGNYANQPDNGDPGPNARLNYLFLNKDYDLNSLQLNWMKLSDIAEEKGNNVPHEKLELDYTATEAGYLYVFLSNDNDVVKEEVFFDNFSVTHTQSPIVASNSYYPFGLTFNSYTRDKSLLNKWKFQGQEHIDDLGLNWDSFKWRNHQPDIGRFFNIDPLAHKYVYNSPYAFSENCVTSHVELEGLEKVHFQAMLSNPKGPKTLSQLTPHETDTWVNFTLDMGAGTLNVTKSFAKNPPILDAKTAIETGSPQGVDFEPELIQNNDGSFNIHGDLSFFGATDLDMKVSVGEKGLTIETNVDDIKHTNAAIVFAGDETGNEASSGSRNSILIGSNVASYDGKMTDKSVKTKQTIPLVGDSKKQIIFDPSFKEEQQRQQGFTVISDKPDIQKR